MSLGVFQRAIRGNIDLLAAGDNDTETERVVAAREDGGVAGRAVGGTDGIGRAVGGRTGSAEVELSAAGVESLEVNGRATARRDDAEVAVVGGSRGGRAGRGGSSRAGRSGHGTGNEGGESDSVLHFQGRSVWRFAGSECLLVERILRYG